MILMGEKIQSAQNVHRIIMNIPGLSLDYEIVLCYNVLIWDSVMRAVL